MPRDPRYTRLDDLWGWGHAMRGRVSHWYATLGSVPARPIPPREPRACSCAEYVALATELARSGEARGIAWRCDLHAPGGWQELRFTDADRG